MRLHDLLYLIVDSSNVKIFKDDAMIAEYNGRNSIPRELNNRPVASMYSGDNYIGINLE